MGGSVCSRHLEGLLVPLGGSVSAGEVILVSLLGFCEFSQFEPPEEASIADTSLKTRANIFSDRANFFFPSRLVNCEIHNSPD
jgi:hypothetical protein